MKIRNGFVSNSSSSSFVISGFYLPKGIVIVEIWKKLFGEDEDFPKRKPSTKERGCSHKEMNAKFCPECGKPMWIEEDYDSEYEDEISDYIYDACDNMGVKYVEDENFIGYVIMRVCSDGDGFSSGRETDLQEIIDKTEKLKKILGLKSDQKAVVAGMVEAC